MAGLLSQRAGCGALYTPLPHRAGELAFDGLEHGLVSIRDPQVDSLHPALLQVLLGLLDRLRAVIYGWVP